MRKRARLDIQIIYILLQCFDFHHPTTHTWTSVQSVFMFLIQCFVTYRTAHPPFIYLNLLVSFQIIYYRKSNVTHISYMCTSLTLYLSTHFTHFIMALDFCLFR